MDKIALFCEAYNTPKYITLPHLGVCYSPFASAWIGIQGAGVYSAQLPLHLFHCPDHQDLSTLSAVFWCSEALKQTMSLQDLAADCSFKESILLCTGTRSLPSSDPEFEDPEDRACCQALRAKPSQVMFPSVLYLYLLLSVSTKDLALSRR